MWQYTTESDCGTDESVELFVATDGKLQMAGCDALDLEILGGVARKFEDFGGEVLKDSRHVHGSY